MLRSPFLIAILIASALTSASADTVTPPIMPKVQETPLPPAVQISAPNDAPADVPNRPLTAEEAANIALNHQPNVAIARAEVVSASGKVKQVRSGLLPSVNTGASYTNTAITPTQKPIGSSVSAAIASGYQVTANLRQLLFDFNHTRALVAEANSLLSSANANLTKVQSDLVLQVKQSFYNFAQNERLVTVNEANVRNAQNHLAAAQARVKSGLGLPADVVRAETAVSDAVFNLNVARNNASTSRVALAQLMGIDPRTPVVAADTSEPVIAADNLDMLVDTAIKQRPEIVQSQANLQAASSGLKAARTSDSPNLIAQAGWLQRGSDFPPGNNSLTYGFAVTWTPFDSGLTKGKITEAQGNLQATQAQAEAARLQVVSDVSQAYLNLKTAEQRAVTADAEVANADESVRLTEGRYRSGLGTFLDVLDAQTALVTANTNRVNAQTAVNQARAALAHAVNAPKAKPA